MIKGLIKDTLAIIIQTDSNWHKNKWISWFSPKNVPSIFRAFLKIYFSNQIRLFQFSQFEYGKLIKYQKFLPILFGFLLKKGVWRLAFWFVLACCSPLFTGFGDEASETFLFTNFFLLLFKTFIWLFLFSWFNIFRLLYPVANSYKSTLPSWFDLLMFSHKTSNFSIRVGFSWAHVRNVLIWRISYLNHTWTSCFLLRWLQLLPMTRQVCLDSIKLLTFLF